MFLLVPAYPGSPGQKAVKRLCVCVCAVQPGDTAAAARRSAAAMLQHGAQQQMQAVPHCQLT